MAMQDWMQNLDPTLTLDQITMPGSHDAGVWEGGTETVGPGKKEWSVCQSLSLGDQCKAGSRFFDVRVKDFALSPFKKELRALHLFARVGAKGQFLDSMLDEVSRFVQSNNGSEFVIMRFTKCTNHTDIITAVQTRCNNQLYKIGGYLSQATVQNLRGKVVAVFDEEFDKAMRHWVGPAQGFHRFGKYGGGLTDGLITCGEFSDSPDLVEVYFGQYNRRIEHDLHTDDNHIFVLYWTQTVRPGNIRELTEGASGTHQGLQQRVLDVYAQPQRDVLLQPKLPTVVLYDFVNVQTSTQIVSLNDPPYR
jgi:hypothetical protein